jgi:hypothetical protein
MFNIREHGVPRADYGHLHWVSWYLAGVWEAIKVGDELVSLMLSLSVSQS